MNEFYCPYCHAELKLWGEDNDGIFYSCHCDGDHVLKWSWDKKNRQWEKWEREKLWFVPNKIPEEKIKVEFT